MSAAVSSASAKLPNGVLVSIGDAPGSVKILFEEMVELLGPDSAQAFMQRTRDAFMSDAAPVTNGGAGRSSYQNRPAQQRPSGGGGWQGGGQRRQLSAQPADPNPRSCEHGPMLYKNFTSTKGNHVELWQCPQEICETQWPPRS